MTLEKEKSILKALQTIDDLDCFAHKKHQKIVNDVCKKYGIGISDLILYINKNQV